MTIHKRDTTTTEHTRCFVTSLTVEEGDAAGWRLWRHDALWGEDRCRLRNRNAPVLALLRTALLRPVLRCGWGTTSEVFARVAARPNTASICSPDALSRDRTQKA